MRVSNDFQHYEAERQIYSVLVMHFQEGITQAEIAKLTNLSHAKVNRLIKQGRELGMVEISIRSQYQALFDLESRFREATGLETVRITPTASTNPKTILQQVGAAAANLLLETGPGRRHRLHHRRQGRQRRRRGARARTAATRSRSCRPRAACRASTTPTSTTSRPRWPSKLGGQAFLIHAPLFADSVAEKDMLMGMKAVTDVFDRARRARVAVLGIGSILSREFELLRPASRARATTAPGSRRPARRASCSRI